MGSAHGTQWCAHKHFEAAQMCIYCVYICLFHNITVDLIDWGCHMTVSLTHCTVI